MTHVHVQDMRDQLRERFAGRQEVFDPPDFRSLADMQALQSAAIATLAMWHKWSAGRQHGRPKREEFWWPLVREARLAR